VIGYDSYDVCARVPFKKVIALLEEIIDNFKSHELQGNNEIHVDCNISLSYCYRLAALSPSTQRKCAQGLYKLYLYHSDYMPFYMTFDISRG
jgi:hypothetical protein